MKNNTNQHSKKGISLRSLGVGPKMHDLRPSSGKRSLRQTHIFAVAYKALNIFLIVATVSVLLFEVHLLTQAQNRVPVTSDDEAEIQESGAVTEGFAADESSACVTALRNYMIKEQVRFGAFINEHFRSSLPASQLIPVAVEKFRLFRQDAREYMANYFAKGGKEIGAVQDEQKKCNDALKKDFDIMKQLLRQHITTNAYAKKTTALLDRYKALNDRLRELNFTVAQFYGYFEAFSQKLPCYATKCVKG